MGRSFIQVNNISCFVTSLQFN